MSGPRTCPTCETAYPPDGFYRQMAESTKAAIAGRVTT